MQIWGKVGAEAVVAGDHGPARVGADTFGPEEIAVAHAAGEDTYAYMAGLGVDDPALDEFELPLSRDLECAIRRHEDP